MPLRRGSGKVLPRQRYRNALLHKMIFIPSLAERQPPAARKFFLRNEMEFDRCCERPRAGTP
jgi:hypothetical protein